MLGRDNTKFKVAGALVQMQIIATSGSPIETVLNGFYTAEAMNFISWNTVCSIFPDTSFNERKTYQLRPADDYFGPLVAKHSRLGWATRMIALELV
jgi:hypothetical protein